MKKILALSLCLGLVMNGTAYAQTDDADKEKAETKAVEESTSEKGAEGATSGVEINETNFPDANFREFVKQYDENGDDGLSEAEIAAVTKMDIDNRKIADLTGINYFTALIDLFCSGTKLTNLEISGLPELTMLLCYDGQLNSLQVENLPKLKYLECEENELTSLKVSNLPQLIDLYCYDNQLEKIELKELPALELLRFSGNKLKSLEVSELPMLEMLDCSSNQLTNIELSGLPELDRLLWK